MPPFRMYLVLSVIFFVVAFFNPRDDFGLLYEAETIEQGAATRNSLCEAQAERRDQWHGYS